MKELKDIQENAGERLQGQIRDDLVDINSEGNNLAGLHSGQVFLAL
jgi:hypothetical protein